MAESAIGRKPARARASAAAPRGRSPFVRLTLGLTLAVGIVVAALWMVRERSNRWVIQQGREMLPQSGGSDEVDASLRRWVERTKHAWPAKRDSLVESLFQAGPATDSRIRAMLERVANVNFADRAVDWERWNEDRDAGPGAEAPTPPARERVSLEAMWKARVGLTAWFSTPLVLDGTIYIPSLGQYFDDANDRTDGVVRIDGKTGKETLFSPPPVPGAADVVGISGGDRCLFVAGRNGQLYSLTPGGDLRWSHPCDSTIVSAPLTFRLPGSGALAAVVLCSDGSAVAVDGGSGQPLWHSRATPGAHANPGAALGLDRNGIWVMSTNGSIQLLDPTNGRVRGSAHCAGGVDSGFILTGRAGSAIGWFGDREARAWALIRSGPGSFTLTAASGISSESRTSLSGLRTLTPAGLNAPLLISCPTDQSPGGDASAWALSAIGTYWRIPIRGSVWGAPAIANLNHDPDPEVILASCLSSGDDTLRSAVQVISSRGHLLRVLELPAAIECPPIVADVNGDDRLELLVADQQGWLHCYKTFRGGPVEWGTPTGDPHNTRNAENAYSFGQTPSGMQWDWRGNSELRMTNNE